MFFVGLSVGLIFIGYLFYDNWEKIVDTHKKATVCEIMVQQVVYQRDTFELVVKTQHKFIELQNASPTLNMNYRSDNSHHIHSVNSNFTPQIGTGEGAGNKVKFKNNAPFTIEKSEHNSILIMLNGNVIADLFQEDLPAEGNVLVYDSNGIKCYVMKCSECETFMPTTQDSTKTCGANCRKKRSLNNG